MLCGKKRQVATFFSFLEVMIHRLEAMIHRVEQQDNRIGRNYTSKPTYLNWKRQRIIQNPAVVSPKT